MADGDEELQHGSTVLPGAPMPWFARPHDAAPPEPEQEPEPETQLEREPQSQPEPVEPVAAPDVTPAAEVDEPTAAVPAAGHGRHRAPDPGPEPASRRRLLVLVGVLLVVLVLAAVALFVWPGLLTSSDSAAGAATVSPPPSAPAGSASATPTATVTLVVPAALAGMTKLSGAADAALTAAVSSTRVAGLTSPVSAVYGRGGVASAQVIAWKATAPPAQDSIDAAFTGFEGSGAKVTAVRPLATGALGGRMSCGQTTVARTPSVLCFWADDVSFGSVTLLKPKDRATAERTALAVRAGVEQKG